MRAPEDDEVLGTVCDETLDLYAAHFGPAPEDIWKRSGASCYPNRGNRCK